MKICSPQLGISPQSSLGGEIYDHQTLTGFTLKGIDVFVYLPKNRLYDKTLSKLHVEYCFITHIMPPWIYSFISLPYLFRTYRREKFDILRIHSPRFLGVAAIIFHIINPKVPILTSAVTVDFSPIFYPIELFVFKISKKIIVQSRYMKKVLVKKYMVDPKKIEVTYGGQISTYYKPKAAPGPTLLKSEDKVILFMGLLVKRKNPVFLAKVFQQSKKSIPNLKMVIIGNGPEKNPLKGELKRLGVLSDTIFIDSAYGSEKSYWLSKMDIFLFPSKDEAFGLSVTEAMSYAKPVIASSSEVFSEIIENKKSGYLLPFDSKAWSKTVIKIIKNKRLATNISQAAKKRVQAKFDWATTFELNDKVARGMVK